MGELFKAYSKRQIKVRIEGAYDFVDVRDVAQGHIAAAEKGQSGETYILSGEHITIQEIFTELEKLIGIKQPRFKMPYWILRVSLIFAPMFYKLTKRKPLFTRYSIRTLRSNADVTSAKAKKELGFQPRPIRESMRDHVEWLKKQGFISN